MYKLSSEEQPGRIQAKPEKPKDGFLQPVLGGAELQTFQKFQKQFQGLKESIRKTRPSYVPKENFRAENMRFPFDGLIQQAQRLFDFISSDSFNAKEDLQGGLVLLQDHLESIKIAQFVYFEKALPEVLVIGRGALHGTEAKERHIKKQIDSGTVSQSFVKEYLEWKANIFYQSALGAFQIDPESSKSNSRSYNKATEKLSEFKVAYNHNDMLGCLDALNSLQEASANFLIKVQNESKVTELYGGLKINENLRQDIVGWLDLSVTLGVVALGRLGGPRGAEFEKAFFTWKASQQIAEGDKLGGTILLTALWGGKLAGMYSGANASAKIMSGSLALAGFGAGTYMMGTMPAGIVATAYDMGKYGFSQEALRSMVESGVFTYIGAKGMAEAKAAKKAKPIEMHSEPTSASLRVEEVDLTPARLQIKILDMKGAEGYISKKFMKMAAEKGVPKEEAQSYVENGLFFRGNVAAIPEFQQAQSFFTPDFLGPKGYRLLKEKPPLAIRLGPRFFDLHESEGFRQRDSNILSVKENVPHPDKVNAYAHETLHHVSDLLGGGNITLRDGNMRVKRYVKWLNEGLTEMNAQKLSEKNGIKPEGSTYEMEVNVAKRLEMHVGEEALRKAYLTGDFNKIRETLENKFSNGFFNRLIEKKTPKEALEHIIEAEAELQMRAEPKVEKTGAKKNSIEPVAVRDSAPLSSEEQKTLLSEKNLVKMNLEDYLLMMRRLSGAFFSHVTRFGVREQTLEGTFLGGHSAYKGEFVDNFTPALKSGKIISYTTSVLEGTEYSRAGIAESIQLSIAKAKEAGKTPDKEKIVSDVLASIRSSPNVAGDRDAVHFAVNEIAHGYYGSEMGYNIYYYFPAEVIAKNYHHRSVDPLSPRYTGNDWNNDHMVWGRQGGIPIDAGIVCIPKDVMVDRETGSQYILDAKKEPKVRQEVLDHLEFCERNKLYEYGGSGSNKFDEARDKLQNLKKEYEPKWRKEHTYIGYYESEPKFLKDFYNSKEFYAAVEPLSKSLGFKDVQTAIAYFKAGGLSLSGLSIDDFYHKSNSYFEAPPKERLVPSKDFWESYFEKNPESKPSKVLYYPTTESKQSLFGTSINPSLAPSYQGLMDSKAIRTLDENVPGYSSYLKRILPELKNTVSKIYDEEVGAVEKGAEGTKPAGGISTGAAETLGARLLLFKAASGKYPDAKLLEEYKKTASSAVSEETAYSAVNGISDMVFYGRADIGELVSLAKASGIASKYAKEALVAHIEHAIEKRPLGIYDMADHLGSSGKRIQAEVFGMAEARANVSAEKEYALRMLGLMEKELGFEKKGKITGNLEESANERIALFKVASGENPDAKQLIEYLGIAEKATSGIVAFSAVNGISDMVFYGRANILHIVSLANDGGIASMYAKEALVAHIEAAKERGFALGVGKAWEILDGMNDENASEILNMLKQRKGNEEMANVLEKSWQVKIPGE